MPRSCNPNPNPNPNQAVACASLVSLEELWLNDNPVAEEAHLADLALLPRLQTLYLASSISPPHTRHPSLPHPPRPPHPPQAGSPISKLPDYVRVVLGLAPTSLAQLDADLVSVHRQREQRAQPRPAPPAAPPAAPQAETPLTETPLAETPLSETPRVEAAAVPSVGQREGDTSAGEPQGEATREGTGASESGRAGLTPL